MKFPRNARILRGHLDTAPYAMVFFLLVIFVLLGSLLYTPGVRLSLPAGSDLPGTDKPGVTVAIDANGRLYFQNQMVSQDKLKQMLHDAAVGSKEPLMLVVQADKGVPYDSIIQLTLLAREAGLRDALLATLPRVIAAPAPKPSS